jgi:hypothetical protein
MGLYDQVLELITPYFNSSVAAEQFLIRQCQFHLQREPTQLGPHDLPNLAKWTMVSGGLQVGKDKAVEMSDRILALRRTIGAVALRDRLDGGNFSM